jgi:hypothetical protein
MDEHAEPRFAIPLHAFAILGGRFGFLYRTHRMRGCPSLAALKLGQGSQRLSHHSPGCSQKAALDSSPPRHCHARAPAVDHLVHGLVFPEIAQFEGDELEVVSLF